MSSPVQQYSPKQQPATSFKLPPASQRIKIHQPDADKFNRFNPRHAIYVRAVKGVWTDLRRRIGWGAMLLFLLLPWLQWGERQAFLLDLSTQKFHLFGLVIWPQDFLLLALVLMTAAMALFFFTTYLGRVWCGYTCPQTVWTFIFIWLEEKIEGTRHQRMKLDSEPWRRSKIIKKTVKHSAWLLVALFTSLTFVSYFSPARSLYIDFFSLQASASAYFAVLFFTAATYGNAGWMREIMCLHICPYARFQSVMFDANTYIVGYDSQRGEMRGPRKRKEDPQALGLGDCIDCDLCVQVCPTGIDIRHGLQYECINCGACVDACDQTMAKMNYASGLISYTTENKLAGKSSQIVRPKLIAYGVSLLLLLLGVIYVAQSIAPMRLDVIRDRNQLYRETSAGFIENTYTLKLSNKTELTQTYQLQLYGLEAYQWHGQQTVMIAAGESISTPISIAVDPVYLEKTMQDIQFIMQIVNDGETVEVSQQSKFFSAL